MTCRFVASDQPRVIRDRHADWCPGEWCQGCEPCREPHCRACGYTHATGTCAECLADARETLHGIARMCGALPAEVEHRGIGGEAMVLLGPTADPEAIGHVEASIAAGRLPSDYLDSADHELHPLFVLGSWDMVWRDALEHDETDRLTVATAVDYLDRQMTYMAGYEHVPFEDFARNLRDCHAHIEAVVHDGVSREEGAPCMSCGAMLRKPSAERRDCKHQTPARRWLDVLRTYPEIRAHVTEERAAREACVACDQGGRADVWECPKCKRRHSEDQYRFAVMQLHREEAEWLTDREMELRTGVKAGTVRRWAHDGHVDKRRDSGRVVFRVAQVVARTTRAV